MVLNQKRGDLDWI